MDRRYIDELNGRLAADDRIFRLSSAEYDGTKLKIVLIADYRIYDARLTEKLKEEIRNASLEILPEGLPFEIAYRKAEATERNVAEALMDYVKNSLGTLTDCFSSAEKRIEVTELLINIAVSLEEHVFSFCITSNVGEKIKKHLSERFVQDVNVEFVRVKTGELPAFQSQHMKYKQMKTRLVRILDQKPVVGKITQPPSYIIDITGPRESATICGTIKFIEEKVGKTSGITFFRFTLTDTTAIINCVYFPGKKFTQENIDKMRKVHTGDTVAVSGPVETDTYSNGFQMKVFSLATCAIDASSIDLSDDSKAEPEKYTTVFPEPYEIEKDKTLLGDDIETGVTPSLAGKTFVVFDLETTGLNWTTEKIIEIAAVKMIDGEVTESFKSLLDPERHIMPETTKLTGIDDEMVQGAPKFEQVIGDFYKFTRGAVLVAHNGDKFDMPFLQYHAGIEGYNFTNESIDTIFFAKQLISTTSYKLSSLCEMFDISLVNAHRALADTIATAKLFVVLNEMKDKKSK